MPQRAATLPERLAARLLGLWVRPEVVPAAPASRIDPERPVLYLLEVGGLADRTALDIVCVAVTEDFLAFTASRGNDLSTPMPAYGFPGLKAGDRWCLCASRWREAHAAGRAPRVYLAATHAAALKVIPLKELTSMAADLN